MRLLLLGFSLAVLLFTTGLVDFPDVDRLLNIDTKEIFKDETIVLFEDLRIKPEAIGDENYNALTKTLNAPNNLQKITDLFK